MGLRNQLLATSVLCIVAVGIGIIETWPSYTIVLFRTENTTLYRPMTEVEISLFGSISCLGSLIATPLLTGYLLDKLGRKVLTLGIAATQVITWIIRSMSKNVYVILASCLLSGIATSATFVNMVFISEFCQETIRGALTSTANASAITGMLISYWIGGTLDYYTIIYICIALGSLEILLILCLKESPTHLMINGLEMEAAKSIAFYRNEKVDSEVVIKELDCIRRALNPELDGIPLECPEAVKLNTENITQDKLSTWQFIKKSRSTRRAFVVCFIISVLSTFQGVSGVQIYAVTLFKDAVPNISSTTTTVILGLVGLISILISGYLTDVAGRRTLLIYSSLAAAMFCILLGTQLQTSWGPPWMTALLIYLFCAAFSFGAGNVPYVLMSELFLPEIKGVACMLIGESFWLSNFIVLFIFNPMVRAIGLASVFYLFSSICIATAVVTYLLLPETKGLLVDEIQLLFISKKERKYPSNQ